jgi:AcrR family transcriptional regulator
MSTAQRLGVPPPDRSAAAERIRNAAIELLYDRGFQATSIRDITQACGVTSGAFYNHYASKDALLFDIASHTHDLCDDYLYAGLTRGGDAADRLWHLTAAIAEFHATHTKEARITSQEFRLLPEPQLEQIRQRRRRVRAMFEHVLAGGIESGRFTPPSLGGDRAIRLLATTITNMAIRISEWYMPRHGMTPQEIAEFHAEIAVRMAVGNTAPPTA